MRASLARIALALVAGAAAIGTGGCWFYAVQYAPMGIQVVTGAASSALGAVEHAAGYHPEEKEYCDALKGEDSSVVQLRTGAGGNPEYRELQIDDSTGDARWAPVTGAETDSDGWRPAVNFFAMNFTPPLQSSIPKTGERFLAYTSSENDAFDNDDRLKAFAKMFAQPAGTFRWGDRMYVYALPTTLPCFAPPK